MPKLKTHSGAAKRFSKTGTGKIKRGQTKTRHILTSKAPKTKRKLGKTLLVSDGDYLKVVAIGNEQGLAQLALRLWRLRSKDVPRLRLAPLDFAGAGLAEALGRAGMGFQLGHCFSRLGLAWLPTPKSPRDRDFPPSLRLQSV